MGRKNHSWDPETDGNCKHCGLRPSSGWYQADNGRVYDVLHWHTPQGVLVGIRPLAARGNKPASAPSMREAFGDTPVRGVPECPKNPQAWTTVRTAGDCW